MSVNIWEGNKAQILLDKFDKQNALLEVMAASALRTLSSDWEGLADLANTGLFGDAYGIGDHFVDTWTDKSNNTEYTYPLQLNHIGDVELEDGEVLSARPFLQAHYAHPFGVQFSHQRAFFTVAHKVTEALTNGTTYYWTRQSDSKAISFKAPSAISAGQWLVLNNGNIEIYSTTGNLVEKVAAKIEASSTGTSLGDSPTLAAGEYYITHTSSTVISFTTESQLEFGDRIGYWDSKVYPITEDGKTVGTAITPGTSTSGTNLGTLADNTRNASGTYLLNSKNEMMHGWNRYKFSALRQYLNSAASINAWWLAQDGFDVRPNELLTKAGFLSGCDESFIDAIKAVKVITYPNTVQDDPGGNTPDITYDKVFLPALEQMYIVPQKAGEGEYHEYWKRRSGSTTPLAQGGTYPNMITYGVENHATAQYVRLRSAYRGSANYAWFVYSSGFVDSNYASGSYRFAPLVVL